MHLPAALFYILGAPITLYPDAGSDLVPRPVVIHPNGDKTKCLDVRGGVVENNTPVQMYVAIVIPVFITVF